MFRKSMHLALGMSAISYLISDASAQTFTLLDVVVLGETRIDGEKFGEFSALVTDPDGPGVIAVSDRGYIANIGVAITGGRLALTLPDKVHLLQGADGTALRDVDFNPEGAALLDDGSLAIVSESGPTLTVFDRNGQWLRDGALPPGLRDAALQASKKDGVEALAWTEASGFLAMLEEPAQGQPRNNHSLHSDEAGVVALNLPGTESISIKGMEVRDGQLFILERTRDDTTDALHPSLRQIDLAKCIAALACAGTTTPLILPGISDADFEGLAALEDGLFLIVSDDEVDGDLRSVFVLFSLP